MIEIHQSNEFSTWMMRLKDLHAKSKILQRLDRIERGNFGDNKSVSGNIFELRIDAGPGYRVYFIRQGRFVVVLLAGGTKRTQDKDILRAISIAKTWDQS